MLQVNIEKIIPVTEGRDMFNKIVDEVEGTDDLYVLTKNGKPAAVVVGVNHLEKLTGETGSEIEAKMVTPPEIGDLNPATPPPVAPQVIDDIPADEPLPMPATPPPAPIEPVSYTPAPAAPIEPAPIAPAPAPVEPMPTPTPTTDPMNPPAAPTVPPANPDDDNPVLPNIGQ